MTSGRAAGAVAGPGPDVVRICHDLIRMDTSVPGNVERPAAEYVAGLLGDAGLDPILLEPESGRSSVVARISGTDSDAPALLIHGHLDVVPAEPDEWTHHPFGGELVDGYLWGRGAVDMKNMDAMMLAAVRDMSERGLRPRRDIVLAFLADEEQGGVQGAQWLVRTRPDLFDGCSEAIGEGGGFRITLGNGAQAYPVHVGEKAGMYVRLTATGRAGHASMVNDDNAVTKLAAAVARIGAHRFPIRWTAATREFLAGIAHLQGGELDTGDVRPVLDSLGSLAAVVDSSLRNTAAPTRFDAGYKGNVIPSSAVAHVDCRLVPEYEDDVLPELVRLAGDGVRVEVVHRNTALETTFEGPVAQAIRTALAEDEPDVPILPFFQSLGTDAKYFSSLGMRCFGFVPLRLEPGLDYARMFHGVDERVSASALRSGVDVLRRVMLAS